jgi:O-Antigen ligase
VALVRDEPLSHRRSPIGPVLWGLGAAILFFSTLAVTAEGMGVTVLALLFAAVGGLVVVFRPELGVLALTSTFLLGYFSVLEGQGRFTVNNLLGLLLLGVLLVRIYSDRDASPLADRHLLLFGVVGAIFVANQMLTATFEPPSELAAFDFSEVRVRGFVSRIAYLLFVIAFIRTRAYLLMLVFTVVALVLMTAPHAIWNALAASGTNIDRVRASADFGITAASNANRLAFVCAVAIAIIGFGMREVRSRILRLLGAGSIGVLITTIFLSASRSGLVNLIVVTLIFVRKTRPRLFVALALLVLLLGVIAMVTSPEGPAHAILEPMQTARGLVINLGSEVIPEKYLQRITSLGLERGELGYDSTTARLGLLKTGVQAFLEHPWVGIGVGNFRWVAIADYQATHVSALHNSYLLALVEGGLLLFIPYVALYTYTWRSLNRSRQRALVHPEVRLGWLVDATQAIFVMFLVFSVFADLWHDVYPFLIVAFSAALAGIYRRVDAPAPSPAASV